MNDGNRGEESARPDASADAETRKLDGLDGLERLLELGGTSPSGSGRAGGGIETDGLDDGLGADEQALRRLLHSAVEDVEPRTGSLEHLRRAVPARRARKRHAAVGMAAAALLLGTAIPALVHVSNTGGTDPNTAMAGQSESTQGTEGKGRTSDGATGDTRGSTGETPGTGKDGGKKDEPGKKGGGETGAPGAADPSASLASGTASCTPAQLGVTGSASGPDSGGVVYGTFRVANVSGTACTVTGAGQVGAVAVGAADQAKLSVAAHVSGDAASGLPDPSLAVSSLVLRPGGAYAEKFAFVPSETCPVPGGGDSTTGGGSATEGPSPDPSPSGDTGTTTGTTDTGGTVGAAPQLLTVDGPADGGVQVTYSTASGAAATAAVPNACAGTVYYTGMQSEG
ncbi:hypothetical protein [Streptomyces sp. NRRL F-2799]|uniref:hypothetical protein n=1 Tax=Streptomyces sp. NRRL F-2799 TaxID=1463844 RepID=UPI000B1CFD17|nr:hypothetical protein [Streptomyces sp. NRRL F-2799]